MLQHVSGHLKIGSAYYVICFACRVLSSSQETKRPASKCIFIPGMQSKCPTVSGFILQTTPGLSALSGVLLQDESLMFSSSLHYPAATWQDKANIGKPN